MAKTPETFKATVFELNKPTLNGRIYTKEVVEAALNDFTDDLPPFICLEAEFADSSITSIDLNKVIGVVNGVSYSSETVDITYNFLDTEKSNIVKLFPKKYKINPFGVGKIDENGIVSDYRIVGFSISYSYSPVVPAITHED